MGETRAGRQEEEADEPISTPEDLNMLSISYHVPGIGFRYTSRFVAAKTRNGTSCSWKQAGQVNKQIEGMQRASLYTYRARDEPNFLLPFRLVRLDGLRAIRVPFWCKLVGEEYDRVSAHPVHTQELISVLFAVARYIPHRLTHPSACSARSLLGIQTLKNFQSSHPSENLRPDLGSMIVWSRSKPASLGAHGGCACSP